MGHAETFKYSHSRDSDRCHGMTLPVDSNGGIALGALPTGTQLQVRTRNTTYRVVTQPGGEVLVSGHPQYCPQPLPVRGLGVAYLTGYVREGYLCPGMRLTFPLDGRRVATSAILEITC